MTIETVYIARYDQRVKLVQDIVKEHGKLSDKQSHALAVRVLEKLDTIPEKLR